MTKIKDILKRAKCKNCENDKPENFTIYFEMDIITRKTQKYLFCENCYSLFEIIEPNIEEYLLEPTISTAG